MDANASFECDFNDIDELNDDKFNVSFEEMK